MSSAIKPKSYLEKWLQYENTRHGIVSRENNPLATYSEFPERFRPGSSAYNLPLFTLKSDECLICRSHYPDPLLEKKYFSDRTVEFPVHPVNLQNPSIPNIEKVAEHVFCNITVLPTASTRTVYVSDESLPPHCLKPHTDLRITRWRRHMEKRKVKHAIAITKMLEESQVFSTV